MAKYEIFLSGAEGSATAVAEAATQSEAAERAFKVLNTRHLDSVTIYGTRTGATWELSRVS